MTDARQRRQFLGAVLAVTLVLLVVLVRHASTDSDAPDGQSAAPGERAAVTQRGTFLATQAMSYDSATAATDVARVEQYMTPEMRGKYERLLPSPQDRRRQAGAGARVVAKVVRAGLISLTEDEASVLVFVNQQASAKSTKDILESPTWRVVHLTRESEQWLLSGMDAP